MIPKIIHAVWVGGKPMTKLAKKCLRSWKKHCPSYEIKIWNETNFDINENEYCKQAYKCKKWAFVSDYIRLRVLFEYGGIYMDLDVEVVKNLDVFLSNKAFSGFETETMIPTGIIASEKKGKWVGELLKYYNDKNFIREDGSMDLTTNVVTITNITEKLCKNLSLDNKYQELEDVTFYPKDYFCPLDYRTKLLLKTKNTYTIHHFAGSWMDKKFSFKAMIKEIGKLILSTILGKKRLHRILLKRNKG